MYRYPDFKIMLARQRWQLYRSAGQAEAGSQLGGVCLHDSGWGGGRGAGNWYLRGGILYECPPPPPASAGSRADTSYLC